MAIVEVVFQQEDEVARALQGGGIEHVLEEHRAEMIGMAAQADIARCRIDEQEGVPVRGDIPLKASTWHSIELQARFPVPEWGGKETSCRQEEEAYVAEDGTRHWVFRRQTDFHLVW